MLSCSTLVTVGAASAGAAIGAAAGGPAGAAAGAIAGWGTAEGIERAQLQERLTEEALGNGGWFFNLMDSITPIIFGLVLLSWFAPAPQDIIRHIKRKRNESTKND